MGPETFGFGERCDHRCKVAKSLEMKLLHGDDLQEIVDAQAAANASCTRSGQNVIGTGSIVSR